MKDIMLIVSEDCPVCQEMREWFTDISDPGIVFIVQDINDSQVYYQNIAPPTILFINDGQLDDVIIGKTNKSDLIRHIKTLWPVHNKLTIAFLGDDE